MPARWNLSCPTCTSTEADVPCSIYDLPVCPTCGGPRTLAPRSVVAKTALFPFEARHVTPDGRPITIDSMAHLRRVEKEYGVVLSAFSRDNISDVSEIKNPPRYRGDDPDFRHDHRQFDRFFSKQ